MNEKKFITKETAPEQTQDRTLSITPNLVFADAHQFNRIFDEKKSKITLDLNNFHEGKGNGAKHFKFNLTLKQFYGLKEALASGYMFFIQPKMEFFADYSMYPPESEGQHKGEWKYRKCSVEFKQGRNYPFSLTNTEGYKDANGKYTASEFTYINMSFETYAYLLNRINNVIDVHKTIYANSGIVSEGYKLVAEEEKKWKKDSTTSAQEKEETYYEPTTQEVPEMPTPTEPQSQPAATQPTETVAPTNTPQTPQKTEIHAVEGIFVSDFQALSNSYIAKFRMENGREYDIHFKEVPEELRTAKEIESRVMINIYAYGDNIIFDSLV